MPEVTIEEQPASDAQDGQRTISGTRIPPS